MVVYSNRLLKTYLHHLYLSEQGSFTLFLWYFSTLHAWVHKHHLCFQMYATAFGFIIIPVHSLRAL